MRKKPTFIALLLLICMLLATACGSTTSSAPPAATSAASAQTSAAPAAASAAQPSAAAPASTEKVKLTWWMGLATDKLAPIYTNYIEAPLWQYHFDATGVEIEFLHPTAGQEREQFNLMLASMDLPDIFSRNINTEYVGGAEKAILDGIIVPLNDLIANNMPALSKLYADNPDWEKLSKTDDGTQYAVPFIRSHPHLLTSWGAMMRKDWLLNMGYAEDYQPVTIEDWYNIAKQMKADGYCEFPFMPVKVESFGDSDIIPGAWDVGWEWHIDQSGELQYSPLTEGFKEYIAEMAKWYSEGLINPDFVSSIDEKTFRSNVMENKAGIFYRNLAGGMGWLYDSMGVKDKGFDDFRLTAVQYPVKEAGQKARFGNRDLPVASLDICITTACAYPEDAARFLDFGFTDEGHMLDNFGVEGVSFEYVDAASVNYPIDMTQFGAQFPKYTELITNNPDQPMSIAMSPYMRSHMGSNFAQDVRYIYQFLPYDDQLEALSIWSNSSDFSGRPDANYRLFYTQAESDQVAKIGNELKTYREETIVAFVTGKQSMDQWDSFMDGLKAMKAEELLEIRRAAFARAKTR